MKNKLIKIFVYTSITIIILFLLNSNVVAQDAQVGVRIPNPSKYDSLEDLVSAASSLIRPVFIITFAAMFLYGAFMIQTARGNDEQMANGWKTIGAAIVGFFIAVFAPSLADAALTLVGVEGFGTIGT